MLQLAANVISLAANVISLGLTLILQVSIAHSQSLHNNPFDLPLQPSTAPTSPPRLIHGKVVLDSAADQGLNPDKGSVGGSPGHGAVHRSLAVKSQEQGMHHMEEAVSSDPERSLLLHSPQVHMQLLRLAFEALLTKQGTLEPSFWTQFPLDSGFKFNLEYLLVWHLSSGPGASLAKELEAKLKTSSSPQLVIASLRLLRLFSRGLFDESRFSELKFQARGAYGSIFRAKDSLASLHGNSPQVIIKTIDLPCGPYERCVLPDVFGEVGIMERYKGVPSICQLIDYGLSSGGEAYWIVMKRYRCSLSEWRLKQPKESLATSMRAALYLSILDQIVDALLVLSKDSVVHFDLKCSNVLIDPKAGVKDSELWSNAALTQEAALIPPFQAVLADFGEARSYRNAEEAFTVRNRGTEVYKSPEMLLLNNGNGKEGGMDMIPIGSIRTTTNSVAATTSSTALNGAGLASDVWSLGCLAYELLSGQVLFGADYATVTHRVAFGGPGNLRLTTEEKEGLGGQQDLIDLIEWILERSPEKRPSLEMIKQRAARVREIITKNQWNKE